MDALLSALVDHVRSGATAPRLETLKSVMMRTWLDEEAITVEDDEKRAILRKGYESEGVELSDDEIDESHSDALYSWMSHIDYVRALAELRPLMLPNDVPEKIKRLVRQARDCYAFQQYDAAIGMCRILLEASMRDVFQIGEVHIKWKALSKKVSDESLKCELRALYTKQCHVVHARSSEGPGDARDVFWKTLQGVEKLYEYQRKT